MVKTELESIYSSRTIEYIINTEGRLVVVVHEVVDKYYDLRLVYKEQHEHVWAEDWTSDGTHHWKACTAEGCAEKDQYGVHQIANGVCTVCKAEVETSGVQTYAVKVNASPSPAPTPATFWVMPTVTAPRRTMIRRPTP